MKKLLLAFLLPLYMAAQPTIFRDVKLAKSGLKNARGQIILPPTYYYILDFREGMAKVKLDTLYGFINEMGLQTVTVAYTDVKNFSEGLAPVQIKRKWGFINKKDSLIIPAKYTNADGFYQGLACVKMPSKENPSVEKYGYINKAGQVVIAPVFDVAYSFKNDVAVVKIGSKYGYINLDGKLVVPAVYDDARQFSEGLAAVQKNGKFGYIDKNNKLKIPYLYNAAAYFSEGLAAVNIGRDYNLKNSVDGLWGYIDTSGTLVVPVSYTTAPPFENGKAVAIKNYKDTIILTRNAVENELSLDAESYADASKRAQKMTLDMVNIEKSFNNLYGQYSAEKSGAGNRNIMCNKLLAAYQTIAVGDSIMKVLVDMRTSGKLKGHAETIANIDKNLRAWLFKRVLRIESEAGLGCDIPEPATWIKNAMDTSVGVQEMRAKYVYAFLADQIFETTTHLGTLYEGQKDFEISVKGESRLMCSYVAEIRHWLDRFTYLVNHSEIIDMQFLGRIHEKRMQEYKDGIVKLESNYRKEMADWHCDK